MFRPSVCPVWSRRMGLSYDVASRLLDVNNVTDTGQLKYAYSYDDNGNMIYDGLHGGKKTGRPLRRPAR
jgi:YD repeat-containing protein